MKSYSAHEIHGVKRGLLKWDLAHVMSGVWLSGTWGSSGVPVCQHNASAKLPGPPARTLKLGKIRMAAPVSFSRWLARYSSKIAISLKISDAPFR